MQEWIKEIPSWAGAITGVVATAMAYLGFNAWRREMFGRTEFELARQILRAAYKLRDHIVSIRWFAGGGANEDDIKILRELHADLWTVVTEAKILWGEDALKMPLTMMVDSVHLFTRAFRHRQVKNDPDRAGDLDWSENSQVILCGKSDDEYGRHLDSAVEDFVQALKRHLPKR